jgi:hypothetical protein
MMHTVGQPQTLIEPDIDAEAERLLALIERERLDARLIGGMAVRLLAADRLHPAFMRPIQDLDFILTKRHRREFNQLLIGAGYSADEQFNALHGSRRLLYRDPHHQRQVDVFVEMFSMCHVLPLADRIPARPRSLPAAEILMTKLQIVELNVKDRSDLYALLLSHEISPGDDSGIDPQRIAALTGNDWGLQRTFELSLQRLRAVLPEQPLTPEERSVVTARIDALAAALDGAPKTRRWRLRARVGERRRWYEEPEEVER